MDHKLKETLSAGECLLDVSTTSASSSQLKDVLFLRLQKYESVTGTHLAVSPSSSLQEIEVETSLHALSVVEAIQQALTNETADGGNEPMIGAKDLTKLRTLISMVFKWGAQTLYAQVSSAWASPPKATESGHRIVDLTSHSDYLSLLSEVTTRILSILFPAGDAHLSRTLVASILLTRHIPDILKPAMALGWLPEAFCAGLEDSLAHIRTLTSRLLGMLQPAESISSLGLVLSSSPPTHIRDVCTTSLSRQLMRPRGVVGLCEAVFGSEQDDGNSDVPLDKLQHVARLLCAVPKGMKLQDYFTSIVPHIISILRSPSPVYRRAAAFTISRLLTAQSRNKYFVSDLVLSYIHRPLLENTLANDSSCVEGSSFVPSPRESVDALVVLLANLDPSPTLISAILSPIVPPLYSLSAYVETVKTSDPELRETLKGILSTWGRTVSKEQGTEIIWRIIDGEGGFWKIDIAGEITLVPGPPTDESLMMLTPEDVQRAASMDDIEQASSLLGLRPDPTQLVRFLKLINQADISLDLFVKLVGAYRGARSSVDTNPMRTMLYLQLLVQMQSHLSDIKENTGLLTRPQRAIAFIQEIIIVVTLPNPAKGSTTRPERHSAMIIEEIQEEVQEAETDGDWDVDIDHEIMCTALNLLLSILEVHPDLSARTLPQLNEIFSLLESLTDHTSDDISRLAKEARMVMTARLASSSTPSRTQRPNDEGTSEEAYQNALKLLQDPILPVRAHGLLLLRQLVSNTRKNKVDEAVVPAILSIFLQSTQDDDSYIFLNAVQGLSSMVDSYGDRILKDLVRNYSGGLGGLGANSLTQRDVDKRLRIGEALSQVIKKCGDALSIYVNIIVPPISAMIRLPVIPTTLKTSAISLLAECVNTHSTSLLPYALDLYGAMVDLLQTESIAASRLSTKTSEKINDEAAPQAPTMDSHPTSSDSKFPLLRRAALHFLSILMKSTTLHIHDADLDIAANLFPDWIAQRVKVTLGYVASTDENTVARVMAREGLEQLEQLRLAKMGM